MATFVISAGHSDTDPGALGFGLREADIAVDAREIVAHYLEKEGHKVIRDGANRTNLPLSASIKNAKTPGVKASIEFHCNAFSNPTAGGTEVLSQDKDKKLAKAIAQAIAETMDIVTRGADGGWKSEGSGQHSRLGFVQAGGLIVELFFITNAKELAIWNAKKWVICKAIAAAIIKNA